MTERPDLAALIGSRICHDLISPIGAIGNGVELLMMEGAQRSPELALISESVLNANARIRFFRVAFGSASPDQRIGRPEVVSVLSDVSRGGRLSHDWQSEADLPRREVKLAFLLLLCLESAMAYGGRVTVVQTNSGWQMTGAAHRLKIDPALWEVLTEPRPPAEIGAGQVHFALVPEELSRQSRRLRAELTETEIRLMF
ncbi:MAG: histidine phosphotransferase family protein [Pseudomonadota bacterium]